MKTAKQKTSATAAAPKNKAAKGPFFQLKKEDKEVFFGAGAGRKPFFNPAPPGGINPKPLETQGGPFLQKMNGNHAPDLQKADEPGPVSQPIRERIQEAVIREMQGRPGGEAAESWELIELSGPRQMANPEPGLGPGQVRYQATFEDYKGEIIEISVNYDQETGQFGIIKFASGKP